MVVVCKIQCGDAVKWYYSLINLYLFFSKEILHGLIRSVHILDFQGTATYICLNVTRSEKSRLPRTQQQDTLFTIKR